MNDSTSDLKQHRCCFTGHRPEKLGVSEAKAKALLKSPIQQAISGWICYIYFGDGSWNRFVGSRNCY